MAMMAGLTHIAHSRRMNLYSGLGLAGLFGAFAWAHFNKFQQTGELTLLLAVVSEALTTGFFVLRNDPKTVSAAPRDWFVGIAGSFLPLLLRPAGSALSPLAGLLIAAGTLFQIVSLLSLNRSFAIVAAKRTIKTAGTYALVRHPLYASYFLIFGGYVLTHATLGNVIVYTAAMGFLYARISSEERHLALDPTYRAYMLRVRYRLIPFLF
jgi:protein-S-isoprenylcysteine O-methyltransferase Ste14